MTALALALVSIVAQSPVILEEAPVASGCATCASDGGAVLAQVVRLQNDPDRRAREAAARSLWRVDRRAHPEVQGALAYALMRDPAKQVRTEAAESLIKMNACGPAVHQAMYRAATRDPSLFTRLVARRGLRVMGRRCTGECNVCEAGPAATILPGEAVITPGTPASVPTDAIDDPSTTLEPLPEKPAARSTAPRAEPGPPPSSVDSRVEPSGELSPLPPAADEPPLRPRPKKDQLDPLPDPDAPKAKAPAAGVIKPSVQAPRPKARVAVLRPRILGSLFDR